MSEGGKLVHLSTAELTAEVLLHTLLGELENVRSIYVVVEDWDECMRAAWSRTSNIRLSMAAMTLEHFVRRRILGADGRE